MRIGTVEINSRVALAPMAGVTDTAFRQLCSELGAGLTCTELISSKALCYRDKKTFSLLRQFPGEHPAAIQIFGSNPVCMAEAAQIAIEDDEGIYKSLIVIVLGDLDGDGMVTQADAMKILELSNGMAVSESPNDIPAGDMNHDGVLTSADAYLALIRV